MSSSVPAPDWVNTLADIEWPAAPDWTPFYLMTAAVLIIAGALIVYRPWRRRAPRADTRRAQALARLATLQDEWQRGALDDRATAYRLATIVRLGLGLTQLTVDGRVPAHIDPHAWRVTLTMLERHRYAADTSQRLPVTSFDTVRDWLHGAAPARC